MYDETDTTIDNNTFYSNTYYGVIAYDSTLSVNDNWFHDHWNSDTIWTDNCVIYADGNYIEDAQYGIRVNSNSRLELSNTDILDVDRNALRIYNSKGNVTDCNISHNYWKNGQPKMSNRLSPCLRPDPSGNITELPVKRKL